MKTVFIILSLTITINFVHSQDQHSIYNEELLVKQAIDGLFDGMRKGDSTLVRSVFHPSARLMTTYYDKEGNSKIAIEELDEFITAVGTPHKEIWDERLTSVNICIDANLAQVWTEYTFYLDAEQLHCGVSAFQLFKNDNGWKIIQLTDTRRMNNCTD